MSSENTVRPLNVLTITWQYSDIRPAPVEALVSLVQHYPAAHGATLYVVRGEQVTSWSELLQQSLLDILQDTL